MLTRTAVLPLTLLALAIPSLLQAQKTTIENLEVNSRGSQIPLSGQTPIQITADLTDGPRKLYHAEVDIPVKPGPVALTTPKWIPGNHRPTGPVDDITGVVFTANGKVLPWRRDNEDLYEFHVTVPDGVTTLHAHLDCIVTARISQKLAVLEWEKLLLYPANTPVKDIAIQPSVKVPEGWGIGTALTPTDGYDPQHPKGGTTHYAAIRSEGSFSSSFNTAALGVAAERRSMLRGPARTWSPSTPCPPSRRPSPTPSLRCRTSRPTRPPQRVGRTRRTAQRQRPPRPAQQCGGTRAPGRRSGRLHLYGRRAPRDPVCPVSRGRRSDIQLPRSLIAGLALLLVVFGLHGRRWPGRRGRGACNRRVGGCDIHAAFDSPTGLIYPAWDTGNLTVRTNAPGGFEPLPKERTFNLVPGFECLPVMVAMHPGQEIHIELEASLKS